MIRFQRELIEQAVGMSTRQVAGLLAAAGPEVVPPRDTLRECDGALPDAVRYRGRESQRVRVATFAT